MLSSSSSSWTKRILLRSSNNNVKKISAGTSRRSSCQRSCLSSESTSSSSSSSYKTRFLLLNSNDKTTVANKHNNNRQQRLLSSSSDNDNGNNGGTYYSSKYQYPLATEPPIITRTKASDVVPKNNIKPKKSDNSDNNDMNKIYDPVDPFDDEQKLTKLEIEDILKAQKNYFSTRPIKTTPITTSIPPYIPKNVPSTELDVPKTQITTLDNGIRIVSQGTYGQVSTIGVVCELGSRTETPNINKGVTNLLELLAFGTTHQYTGQQITELLQDWGGTRFVNCGREQSLFCIDLLRPNVNKAVNLLNQIICHPTFDDDEVQDAKVTLQYSLDSIPPDLLLGEALQRAAYGSDQQLGRRHYATGYDDNTNSNDNTTTSSSTGNDNPISLLTSQTCKDYWHNQLLQNPGGIVIGGAGVEHDYLVHMIKQSTDFDQLRQSNVGRSPVIASQYRGGEYRWSLPDPMVLELQNNNNGSNDSLTKMPTSYTIEEQNYVKVAIAFEVGGWQQTNQQDLVTTCVLQTLLGGGSSFSAGGPGKGMYSRLYRQILNRYSWAESAEAFTSFHNESGLFGIMGTTHPYAARDMTSVISEHLLRLTIEKVSDEELDRARNMLKNNVLTQLESRLVLFEDLSRQVLTYGQREDMNITVAKIQQVTAEDIQTLAIRALQKPPTIACVGIDLSSVPRHSDIIHWFR